MTSMMLAAYITIVAMLYLMVAGVVASLFVGMTEDWETGDAILGGVFWPLVGPLMLGYQGTLWLKNRKTTQTPKKAKLPKARAEFTGM